MLDQHETTLAPRTAERVLLRPPRSHSKNCTHPCRRGFGLIARGMAGEAAENGHALAAREAEVNRRRRRALWRKQLANARGAAREVLDLEVLAKRGRAGRASEPRLRRGAGRGQRRRS